MSYRYDMWLAFGCLLRRPPEPSVLRLAVVRLESARENYVTMCCDLTTPFQRMLGHYGACSQVRRAIGDSSLEDYAPDATDEEIGWIAVQTEFEPCREWWDDEDECYENIGRWIRADEERSKALMQHLKERIARFE